MAGPHTSDPAHGLNITGSMPYTILITSVAALGAVMFGFDIAIISGAAPFVKMHFALSDLELGWGVSSLILGCMAGCLVAGRAADRFGRKNTLLWIALLFAVTSVASGLAPTFSVLVIARIIGGFAVGAASMVSPMYIAEVSPSNVRGRMVALNQLGITFGILVSYLINYLLRSLGETNWRWMFATGALPSVMFFVLLFVVPESPRWLYNRGRRDNALAVLTRIGGLANAQREMSLMGKPVSVQEDSSGFAEVLSPRYRRVMLVGALLAILIQVSGINTVIEYAPIILSSAGNGMDMAMFQTFVIGIINFLFTFVAVFTVDKAGRRALYLAGSVGMTVALTLISAGFATGHLQGSVGLALILIFIASFAGCIGPVFWILMAEIFPTRVRGSAMSVAVFINWATNFLVVLFFPWLLSHIGGAITFAVIAVMALAMVVVALKLLPETKGKTLEEIESCWEMTNA